jgi:preprotein translocase SecE subunit
MSFPVSTPPTIQQQAASRPVVQAGPAFPTSPLQWPAYLKATAQEWQRISWPPQMQVVGLTVLVVVIVTAMTLILWGMDVLLRYAIQFITPH